MLFVLKTPESATTLGLVQLPTLEAKRLGLLRELVPLAATSASS